MATTDYQPVGTIQNGNELMACLREYLYNKFKGRKRNYIIILTLFSLFVISLAILGYLTNFVFYFMAFLFFVLGLWLLFMVTDFHSNFNSLKLLVRIFNGGGKCIYEIDIQNNKINFDFFVPASRIVYDSQELRDNLYKECKKLMPWIGELKPYLTIYPIVSCESGKVLETELEKILEDSLFSQADFLPQDILHKGRDISEAYVFLYVVENSLRIFIQKTAISAYGINYLSRLKLTREINKSITIRKENEEKNKWLSIRGDDDLFYLDFKDLAIVITENWDLFKSYFDQHWIKSKIEELANVRNLVAHNNSFIDDYSKDILRLNFYQILRQIKRQ